MKPELCGFLGRLLSMCQAWDQAEQADEQTPHQRKPVISPRRSGSAVIISQHQYFSRTFILFSATDCHSLIEVCL